MKLKLGYFGSPNFSAQFLEKLLQDKELKKIVEVVFVATQPDKPKGRKQVVNPTPVKQIALQHNLEVIEDIKKLKLKIKNLDLCLVYAYAQIIPQEILELPKYGFWCLHPSLLPKYRGPSPIAFTLINGEKQTGMTIFKMDEKIDHGPIIDQKKITIKNTDYRIDLELKLTQLGFEMIKETLTKLISKGFNQLQLTPQNHNQATYTKKITKQDGFIKFRTLKKILQNQLLTYEDLPDLLKEKYKNSTSEQFDNLTIYNLYRGLHPWPGIWTILPNGKRLKIIELDLLPTTYFLQPKTVQLEGKKPVDFSIFCQAYNFF